MTKQLLIYGKVVAVSKERHLNWSVKSGKDYSFARATNSLPLMAVEFPSAASEYTIIFVGSKEDNAIMPALILGVRDENLYLTETGDWNAKYVPAFVRRYPFVFSSSNDSDKFILCIDEDFEGCNQEGRGERLFDADGEQTQFLDTTLEFLKEYQAHFQRTQLFCQRLNEFNLLEPMHASLTLKSGEKYTLDGFMAVSRDKLKELSGEQLAKLVALDELELIYLHLQSIRNFSAMGQLVSQTAEAPNTNKEQELSPVA